MIIFIDELQNLAYKMVQNGITFKVNHLEVQDVSEIYFGLLSNHIFVVDFSCEGTKYLLQKVDTYVLFL